MAGFDGFDGKMKLRDESDEICRCKLCGGSSRRDYLCVLNKRYGIQKYL